MGDRFTRLWEIASPDPGSSSQIFADLLVGPREAGVGDTRGDAAAGVGGLVPDAPGSGEADLPVGRGRRRGPGRDPGGAGQGAGLLLPLAGRIVEGEQPGAPHHPLHRRRRLLAEAEADCNLEDVRFLERPVLLPEDLVPYPNGP
jgi:hypothetical protein